MPKIPSLACAALTLTLAVLAGPAFAADDVPTVRLAAGDIRIAVSTGITLLGSTATAEQESALATEARASLYKMSAAECTLIEQAFKGKCSLEQIQVTTHDLTSPQYGGNPTARDGVTAQGNFTYRLAR